MTDREKVPLEVVRSVVFRPQPYPDRVGHDNPQVALVQRPNWSRNYAPEAWQLIGGRFYPDESYEEAVQRVTKEETGFEIADFLFVENYQNGEWLSRVFYGMINPELVHAVIFSHEPNQGFKWFDTKDGQVVIERRAEGRGRKILERNEIAFDHPQIIAEALKRLRGEN